MPFDYSELSKGMQEAFEQFGTVFQLPVIQSPFAYLKKNYNNKLILDVGAGVELYVKELLSLDHNTYFSLDNDLSGKFDYRDITDIPAGMKFYWIVLNQILEHLTIEEAFKLLIKLNPHLSQDGKIIITVPNISHPIRYWTNPTHVTPWGYSSLYALSRITGYKVKEIYRYNKKPRPLDPLSWVIERIMRRLYRVDWCDSIMLIGQK